MLTSKPLNNDIGYIVKEAAEEMKHQPNNPDYFNSDSHHDELMAAANDGDSSSAWLLLKQQNNNQ